ncbi:hypothetical protein CONCODRAFT_78640 [Conidiobolus coronatus NRRL 28638]|uniref:Uncharacterized protein n=1 Tax=Conidiobolus coronatus (strain ATCC 28846 / CBS 209.66 / NRRL 28638) TaxID=796925 RepID=A0A137P7A2_CONC2|nr:hypothetical protein CONCODRAFT_78640 [Conidiobolus coronatus NRRL 28638]|eukprot:KXN70897.1 hypothetical protein CONCODRAFT_78640 [Conidiobolus coronatus NRRL 28638]
MINTEKRPKVVKNMLYNLFRYNRLDFTTRPDYYLYLTDKDMEELKMNPSILNYDPTPMINTIGSNIYDISNSAYNTMDKLLNFSFTKPIRESSSEFNAQNNYKRSEPTKSKIEKSTILTESTNSDENTERNLNPHSFLDFFSDKNSPFFNNIFDFKSNSENEGGMKSGWSYSSVKTYTDEDGTIITERRTRDFNGKEEVTVEKSQPPQSSSTK